MHRWGRVSVSVSDDQAARCRFSVEDYRDLCTPLACSDHIKAKWCEVQFCSVLFMCDGFDFDIPLRQEQGRTPFPPVICGCGESDHLATGMQDRRGAFCTSGIHGRTQRACVSLDWPSHWETEFTSCII